MDLVALKFLFFCLPVLVSSLLNTTEKLWNCPTSCKCFSVDKEVTSVLMGPYARTSVNVTTCQRVGMQVVPSGISKDSTDLYLAYNKLTNINATVLVGLEALQVLDLSNNQIESIPHDTFNHLINLVYVDLSYNQLQNIPNTLFCPWNNRMVTTSCQTVNKSEVTLHLRLEGNKWHCTCSLQQFIVKKSCFLFSHPFNFPCIQFLPIQKTTNIPRVFVSDVDGSGPIGFCHTPDALQGFPLNRLAGKEHIPRPAVQVVNTCLQRKGSIDYVMFVVVFTWIGVTIAYIIHFISWNNREVTQHKSYISSLNSNKAPEQTRQASPSLLESHQFSDTRVVLRSERSSVQNLTDASVTDDTKQSLQLHVSSSSLTPPPNTSPIWKLRSSNRSFK